MAPERFAVAQHYLQRLQCGAILMQVDSKKHPSASCCSSCTPQVVRKRCNSSLKLSSRLSSSNRWVLASRPMVSPSELSAPFMKSLQAISTSHDVEQRATKTVGQRKRGTDLPPALKRRPHKNSADSPPFIIATVLYAPV